MTTGDMGEPEPKYNDIFNQEYRDIFYLYAHGLINSYNEWLSVDMLDSDTDEELMCKARDIKYYHEIYKHIDRYFDIKGNRLTIQETFLDDKVKIHKELLEYVTMEEYGNIELDKIIYRIAEMGELLYYDKNTLMLSCICGTNCCNNNENYHNENYDNNNYDDENYYTYETWYYENYNENDSINNTL